VRLGLQALVIAYLEGSSAIRSIASRLASLEDS
jgi:hypothetical protein